MTRSHGNGQEHEAMGDEKTPTSTKISAIVGGSGAASILAAVLWTHIETVRNEGQQARTLATTAVEVAAQHGTELNEVRANLRELLTAIADVRAQMSLGGRFTRDDGMLLRDQLMDLQKDVIAVQKALASMQLSQQQSAHMRNGKR